MPQIKYSWDVVNDTVSEEVSDGNLGVQYDMRPERFGESLSQFRSGSTSYYFYDAQGSTRNLTDELGNVSDEYTFAAFGEEISATGSTLNSFRYGGASGYLSFPNSSVQYIRARNYSVVDNRWLSIDPVQFVDGPNNYLYLNNQPINFRDPSGKLKFVKPEENNEGCGTGMRLSWDLELNNGDEWGGYLVQKIDFYCDRIKCPFDRSSGVIDLDDCPKDPPEEPMETFYIAWWVEEKATKSKESSTNFKKLVNWVVYATDGECGAVRFVAETRFYSAKNIPDLGRKNSGGKWKTGQEYGNGRCKIKISSQPSTSESVDPPKFWSKPAKESAPKKSATARFQCCQHCRPKTYFEEDA